MFVCALCRHFIHAYSPHISFNFLHVLSFSSASYTLCEYECVRVHLHFLLSFFFFVSFFFFLFLPFSFCLYFHQQTVSEVRVCLLLLQYFLTHVQCPLFLVLLTQFSPFLSNIIYSSSVDTEHRLMCWICCFIIWCMFLVSWCFFRLYSILCVCVFSPSAV